MPAQYLTKQVERTKPRYAAAYVLEIFSHGKARSQSICRYETPEWGCSIYGWERDSGPFKERPRN